MANLIQRTVLVDQGRHFAMHFFLRADGSGDLVNEVVIDPQIDFQDTSFVAQGATLAIDQMWWDTSSTFGNSYSGFLSYDAPTPQYIWPLSNTPGDTHQDFREFGGIKDKTGIDGTGRLLITTFGLTDTSAEGVLIVVCKKYTRPPSQYPMGAIGGPVSESTLALQSPTLTNDYSRQ